MNILFFYGYSELGTGKTSGSRRRFADDKKNVIVKQYAIRQIIEDLREKGKIKDE